MDQSEARAILDDELNRLRRMSHAELAALVDKDDGYHPIIGPSGIEYNRWALILGDGPRQLRDNICVIVFVDDGSYDNEISDDFIMRADGTFIEVTLDEHVAEARAILETQLERLRELPYAELVARVGVDDGIYSPNVRGPSGAEHIIQIVFVLDGGRLANVGVLGTILNGAIRSGFIMAPDGSFIGQSF